MKQLIINFLQKQSNKSCRRSRLIDELIYIEFDKAMSELIEEGKVILTDTNLYTYEILPKKSKRINS